MTPNSLQATKQQTEASQPQPRASSASVPQITQFKWIIKETGQPGSETWAVDAYVYGDLLNAIDCYITLNNKADNGWHPGQRIQCDPGNNTPTLANFSKNPADFSAHRYKAGDTMHFEFVDKRTGTLISVADPVLPTVTYK
jgi:hypothetical protein